MLSSGLCASQLFAPLHIPHEPFLLARRAFLLLLLLVLSTTAIDARKKKKGRDRVVCGVGSALEGLKM